MSELIPYIPILINASLITFGLAIFSMGLATILGALGAYSRLSPLPYIQSYGNAYIGIVRGIPDLVLILLIYYGFQRILNAITEPLGMGVISLSTFWAGVVAIGVIYGAYLTETFRGAYLQVPKGQDEAARALGMRRFARFYKVLLPQIIRFALPGYGNVFQVLIKSTAVVGVIGLNDLVGLANDAGKTTREPLIFLSFVFVIYLIYNAMISKIMNYLEKRYQVIS